MEKSLLTITRFDSDGKDKYILTDDYGFTGVDIISYILGAILNLYYEQRKPPKEKHDSVSFSFDIQDVLFSIKKENKYFDFYECDSFDNNIKFKNDIIMHNSKENIIFNVNDYVISVNDVLKELSNLK